MKGSCSLLPLLLTVTAFQLTDCRQMCLSCQYQQGLASGYPCNNDPDNWLNGNTRMRCPHQCTFEVRQNMDTITFSHRGCSASDTVDPDGCVEYIASQTKRCYYTCGGVDYCNNWNATDLLTSSAAQLSFFWSLFPVAALLSLGITRLFDV
ncbi:hypothetical protein BaRGS_00026287 [Batillaria attramentaria]|uniref:Protein quiver n=1 Tax=Batillaria attramentaria TaxID=370345 RepID=A0ABD0K6A8_9CAEN